MKTIFTTAAALALTASAAFADGSLPSVGFSFGGNAAHVGQGGTVFDGDQGFGEIIKSGGAYITTDVHGSTGLCADNPECGDFGGYTEAAANEHLATVGGAYTETDDAGSAGIANEAAVAAGVGLVMPGLSFTAGANAASAGQGGGAFEGNTGFVVTDGYGGAGVNVLANGASDGCVVDCSSGGSYLNGYANNGVSTTVQAYGGMPGQSVSAFNSGAVSALVDLNANKETD